MTLVRTEIGDTLRAARRRQNRTLRDVSTDARVSLGYLSEIERGQKEASSELLASICGALDVPVSVLLREVSDRMALAEGVEIPDTVPVELSESYLAGEALDGAAMARDGAGRSELGREGLVREALERDALARSELSRDDFSRDALAGRR